MKNRFQPGDIIYTNSKVLKNYPLRYVKTVNVVGPLVRIHTLTGLSYDMFLDTHIYNTYNTVYMRPSNTYRKVSFKRHVHMYYLNKFYSGV